MAVATEVPEALAESNPDSGTKMICCVYISLHSLDALDTLPHLIPPQEDASERWASEGTRAFRSSGRDLDSLHRCLLDKLQ